MKVQCNTCGGVYEPVQADGMRYFHACPPLVRLVVQNLDGTLSTVDRDKADGRPVVDYVSLPRPDARDENIVDANHDKTATMKAAGGGVTPVAILDTQKG